MFLNFHNGHTIDFGADRMQVIQQKPMNLVYKKSKIWILC